MVEHPGSCAECTHDAGASGTYCSPLREKKAWEVNRATVAVGTEGVSVLATGGSAVNFATVAFILAGHGVSPYGPLVSPMTTNLRVNGTAMANTDNGPGVGHAVI